MSDRERDRAALDSAIDAGANPMLLALADWHEEGGEADTAAGYRWLAAWGRRPARHRVRLARPWVWWLGHALVEPSHRPTPRRVGFCARCPEDLPRVRMSVGRSTDSRYCRKFRTESKAYHAAAVAVGRWLKEGS